MSVVLKMKSKEADCEAYDNLIGDMVTCAADVVAPVWPLKTFIACNPLQGFEELPFEKAVAKASRYQRIGKQPIAEREAVNREMIKWLGAFLDEGQATISMPNKNQGFYKAFRDLARFDSQLRVNRKISAWLAALPDKPELAIADSFERLNIATKNQEEFIRQSLAALPGWSGYVKWREQWQNPIEGENSPINLTDYAAVCLIITCVLWPEAKVFESEPLATPAYLDVLPTAEQNYRHTLLNKLVPEIKAIGSTVSTRPDAQLVFCIDVRSEPFLRPAGAGEIL
jgi:uncharacterized protein YbcC (UPF0753/DUF2309 family)